MKHRLSSTFGESRVTIKQRQQLVRSVFKRVANRYDLMNDLMSMGIHRFWKWQFVRQVNSKPGMVYLDLAGGTGDIAKALINNSRVMMIIDSSEEMLCVAKKRLGSKPCYISAASEAIPIEDNSVDILTISFGIRNATDINMSLKEVQRVLKPGGRFYCLEFSTPSFWLRPFYNAWSRFVIPRLGALVAGHPDAYHYLVESIREFPAQQEMADIIAMSGLSEVSYRNLSFGIACIHKAEKPHC